MKDADQLLAEVERLEAWFRTVCPPISPRDVAAIRRRVQIAVEEERLAAELASPASQTLADRAKANIRAELAGQAIQLRPRTFKLAWWVGSGLSAVAAIGLAVVGLRTPPPGSATDLSPAFVAAFEQFDEDDFDKELRDALSDADEFLEGSAHWIDSSDAEDSLQ